MQMCQRWYSCRKHRWNILAGGSRTGSLVVVMTSSTECNLPPRRSAFMREKETKIAWYEIRWVRRVWQNGDLQVQISSTFIYSHRICHTLQNCPWHPVGSCHLEGNLSDLWMASIHVLSWDKRSGKLNMQSEAQQRLSTPSTIQCDRIWTSVHFLDL